MDPTYPDIVMKASVSLHGPDPKALSRLDIPQPSVVATNQRQNEAETCRSEMQGWWDKSIKKNLGLPDGYQKVSVLLIKWDDKIDQLKVKQEVNDIGKLFKDTFNYQTDLVELRAAKPQLQLESQITHFAHENDAKHNLLILYYAGHGIYHNQEKDLYLAASDMDDESGNELPRVSWKDAIRTLVKNAEGDIFALMDCCFASNPYARSICDYGKTFEILAASGFNQITSCPGEDSFTTALIQSLKELAAEFKNGSFSTRDLHEKILVKRPDSPPALWRGLPNNNRHVRLSPMKDGQEPRETRSIKKTSKGLLSLQFALEIDHLSHSQIEKLTRNLPRVFRSAQAPVQNVVWLDFKNARPPKTTLKTAATMITSLQRWKNLPGDSSKSSTRIKRKAGQMTPDDSDDVSPKKKMVESCPESSPDY